MAQPLIVGVDVRALRLAKTGIKTYLEELCIEFRQMNDANLEFHFLDSDFPVYTGNNKLMKLIEHLNFQLWKQVTLPLKAWSKKCHIVFCTDSCVPYLHLGYKTVPTIHDAFCYESPENYGRIWLWFYKRTAIPAAKRSPFVITTTLYSKGQISKLMDIATEKLIVVYEGPKRTVSSQNQDLTTQKPRELNINIPSSDYILHVGAMYKRKNIASLVYAFSKVKKSGYPELKLVLAGSLLTNKADNEHQLILDAIESTGMGSDIIITGYLSDQTLEQVYRNALIYVFPSLNEGFGLPILEAFKSDLPVLASNNTCLPEVGGDAVLLFNPFDINDISEKIDIVLKDPLLRASMIRKGRERLRDFSWQRAALEIIEVFRKAARGK